MPTESTRDPRFLYCLPLDKSRSVQTGGSGIRGHLVPVAPIALWIFHVAGAGEDLVISAAAIGVDFHAAKLGKHSRVKNVAEITALGSRLVVEFVQPAGIAGGDVQSIGRFGKGGRLAGCGASQVNVGPVFVDAVDSPPIA